MKKLVLIIMAFALIVGCQAKDASKEKKVDSGTFKVTAKGMYGDFDVTFTTADNAITKIEVGENKETAAVGGKAIKLMSERIIDENSVDVDIVTGATVTSTALRRAVETGLKDAKATDGFFKSDKEIKKTAETIDTDVLVVGAGAAGFSAAIKAAQNGAKVTLIEKQDIIGGSTLISAGIVYAALDESDKNVMQEYYVNRAAGDVDLELLKKYVDSSIGNIEFLESVGVKWLMKVPSGTAAEPRAHFSVDDKGLSFSGAVLINALEAKAKELGIEILTGVKATELVKDGSGVIVGAKASSKTIDYTFNSNAVVMATGGYDSNTDMKKEYAPIIADEFPLSSKGNTGDGIKMGVAVGADTVFKGGAIGFVSVHPTLSNSGQSGIAMGAAYYVLPNGTFGANKVDYPITHTAINKANVEFFYGLFDKSGAESAQVAVDLGYGYKADTIEELAKLSGMNIDNLKASMAQNDALKEAPYFAVEVRPTTIGTMGGLKVNTNSEVLNASGSVIPGLYAAGEVANGDLYNIEYPASGTSISMCITYGLIAGEQAALFSSK